MSGRASFGERLTRTVAARGNLCLGIDPHAHLLAAWGLGDDAAGLAEFSSRALEAFGDLAAAVKPQVAFYERHGSAGLAVLEDVLAEIGRRGALSVADAKRGDIGSTMAGYAEAWLADGAPLACDALTCSPYLGVGALEPAFELAARHGRGLFVLARTSNPEATSLQEAALRPGAPDGAGTVAQHVVDEVGARNRELTQDDADPGRCGPFGVVVGATLDSGPDLTALDGPVLMPGVGAQGGTLEDVRRLAGPAAGRTLVNLSREVLGAGPDPAAMREVVQQLDASYRLG